MKKGCVYLVGAGPGDSGLLTVRGLSLLRRADLVAYDHLVSPEIVKQAPRTARRLYVGKELHRKATTQQSINATLIRAAKSGKTVVRLKGGDPFIFGRGAEEALELTKAKIAYEVVPGITSALSVPAYAGIPLTHRGLSSSVALITGHENRRKLTGRIRWKEIARACDTIVCLMAVKTLPKVVSRLLRYGRSQKTCCAVIEWGTLKRQRTISGELSNIVARAKRANLSPPAVLVVGDVVSLRKELSWFDNKPLIGKRVLVTRAAKNAGDLAKRLESLGAQVTCLPAIKLAPIGRNGAFKQAIERIPDTDWIFFTSPEGIGWFVKILKSYRKDIRILSGSRVGVIGQKTAGAVEAAGAHVDFVPRRFSQEGMLKQLPSYMLRGKSALIFCAQESRKALEAGLRRRGMSVTKVPIYRTAIPKALMAGIADVARDPFDFVTVTSASCVDHLYEALRRAKRAALFRKIRFASIGPVTSAAVCAHGGKVVVEASVSTIEGLVEALARA